MHKSRNRLFYLPDYDLPLNILVRYIFTQEHRYAAKLEICFPISQMVACSRHIIVTFNYTQEHRHATKFRPGLLISASLLFLDVLLAFHSTQWMVSWRNTVRRKTMSVAPSGSAKKERIMTLIRVRYPEDLLSCVLVQ